jgi:uncharacterized protein involved in exopolysaccharide biosynthesis
MVELVARLVAKRWLVVRNVLITCIGVGLLSFMLPRRYTAVTTLLPPAEVQQNTLQAMLEELPAVPLSFGRPSSPAALFVEILKSRSVREMVLRRTFTTRRRTAPLLELLHASSLEAGLQRLARCTTAYASDQGIITIKVEMPHPQLAADVANAMVEALDRLNQEKSVSRAKNSRLYIEKQLALTEQKLREASKALAEFQQSHKAVALEEQTKAAIESAGDLKGRIIAKQVELGTLRLTMRPDNPQLIMAERELEEMQARYHALQFGEQSSPEGDHEVYIPIAQLPEVARQLAELIREVKVQETVWGLLNQQYYQARIQEARDTPTIQQLDPAVPPERPSKPRRLLMVITAGIVAAVASMMWVTVRPLVSLAPTDAERLRAIGRELAGDWHLAREKIAKLARVVLKKRRRASRFIKRTRKG